MNNNQPANKQSFIERLASLVSSSVNSETVFHSPIEHKDIILIPVAKIRYGFGGGYGHKKTKKAGKGGGGGAVALPVGYIEVKDKQTQFKPIRIPASISSIIFASSIAGYLLFRLIKSLRY